mgnify:CR=1 FL=1
MRRHPAAREVPVRRAVAASPRSPARDRITGRGPADSRRGPAIAAVLVGALGLSGRAAAGTVSGRLELPPPPARPPVIARGFLDRIANPLAELQPVNLAPYLAVALDAERAPTDGAPGQVTWDLVGESFARPVIAVPVGAEVVIRNVTSTARSLKAAEDPQLLVGPLNPTGSKSFRATKPTSYAIADADAPHLRGHVVVVATRFVATVDDVGRFELADVPEGAYTLRVFYADPAGGPADWLPVTAAVVVGGKGKARTEVALKLPPLAITGAARAAAGGK